MQKSDFFEGITHAPVKVGNYDIRVPIFYHYITSMGVFLLAPPDKVRTILPSKRMNPFRVTPWHCLVTITASEYKETDFGPYHLSSSKYRCIYSKGTVRIQPVKVVFSYYHITVSLFNDRNIYLDSYTTKL